MKELQAAALQGLSVSDEMAGAQSEVLLPWQHRKQWLLQRHLELEQMLWPEPPKSLDEATAGRFHPVAFG